MHLCFCLVDKHFLLILILLNLIDFVYKFFMSLVSRNIETLRSRTKAFTDALNFQENFLIQRSSNLISTYNCHRSNQEHTFIFV